MALPALIAAAAPSLIKAGAAYGLGRFFEDEFVPDVPQPPEPPDIYAGQRRFARKLATQGDPMGGVRRRQFMEDLYAPSPQDMDLEGTGLTSGQRLAVSGRRDRYRAGALSDFSEGQAERDIGIRTQAGMQLGQLRDARTAQLGEYQERLTGAKAARTVAKSRYRTGLLRSAIGLGMESFSYDDGQDEVYDDPNRMYARTGLGPGNFGPLYDEEDTQFFDPYQGYGNSDNRFGVRPAGFYR